MRAKVFALLALCPIYTFSLDVKPWFGDLWEFYFDSSYTYSHYRQVQNSTHSLKHASNDQRLAFDLEISPFQDWQAQIEAEFAHTPRFAWGMRSTALSLRTLWLNDIAGDTISLTTGILARYALPRSLHDVSTPYHYRWNFALDSSFGKEWSNGGPYFNYRTFGNIQIGFANRGAPWLIGLAAFQTNYNNHHRFLLWAETYIGFGGIQKVNISHFDGYANIAHRNVDIGTGYTYHMDVWGSINLDVAYRVWAHSFPERVIFATLSYKFPFSFF